MQLKPLLLISFLLLGLVSDLPINNASSSPTCSLPSDNYLPASVQGQSVGTEYYSENYNTYVFFSQNFYATEAVADGNCIAFENLQLGSPNAAGASFGIGAVQGGNVTINGASGIVLQESTQAGKIENVTIYNPGSVSVVQVGSTLVKSASFVSSYSAWQRTAAPAVFYNSSANYVVLSATGSPLILIDPPSVICLSSVNSNIDAALELFSIICVVLAAVFILRALKVLDIPNPMKRKVILSFGSMDTELSMDMSNTNVGAGHLVFLIIFLIVSSFIALYFSGVLQGLLGC